MTFTLDLPWPTRPLWQNVRCHWASRSAATKRARHDAWAIAACAGIRPGGYVGARLVWTMYPPDRRLRDLPNCMAAMKAAIDGIADALGVDDSAFRHVWPEAWAEPVKGGLVRVTVQPIAKQVAA